MLWAWPVEAGIFLLTWAGILRIGEVLGSKRRDLILPSDAAPGTTWVLLRITTPKTRGRAAKHQSSRVDQSDVVEYLQTVFGPFQPDQYLWPMSSSTLRKRMNMLLTALGVSTTRSHECCPYDLGSFRPGGATDLLNRFEDSELVRRRGRWISSKVLEIYLQEVSTATYQQRLSEISKSRVARLADSIHGDPRKKCQQLFAVTNSDCGMEAPMEHTSMRFGSLGRMLFVFGAIGPLQHWAAREATTFGGEKVGADIFDM